MKTTRVALAVALATLATSPAAFAQQASAGSPTAAPPSAKATGPSQQGFSVVLVLGDLQGASTADDVPLAARKALTDMKDFLPYKSYKLLDAAWVMCCAPQARGVNMPGGASLRQSTSLTQSLRGPDDQEYELQLRSSRNETGRVFVSFELSSMGASPLEKLTEKLSNDDSAPQRQRFQTNPGFHESRRSIIDTSFLMDVGETVVVGTSRVKGGSRALIALLTAVPSRGAAARE